jgi:hypothetical protein
MFCPADFMEELSKTTKVLRIFYVLFKFPIGPIPNIRHKRNHLSELLWSLKCRKYYWYLEHTLCCKPDAFTAQITKHNTPITRIYEYWTAFSCLHNKYADIRVDLFVRRMRVKDNKHIWKKRDIFSVFRFIQKWHCDLSRFVEPISSSETFCYFVITQK